MSAGAFEYKVDGLDDDWREARPLGNWRMALDECFDLLTLTEVAFTLGSGDTTVTIRYREKKEPE